MPASGDNAERLEEPPCPRCGELEARSILEGRDHLHGSPHRAKVSECTRCGLWYQRPRLPRAKHGQLYPIDYAPHADRGTNFPTVRPMLLSYLARKRGYAHFGTRPLEGLARWIPDWVLRWRIGVSLIPAFGPRRRVLDVGCGEGEMLRLLQSLGWSDVHGIELDPDAAARAGRTGAHVQVGAFEDAIAAYPDGYFDAIIASMVIEHVTDPYAVMAEISRALRSGGELLLSTVTRDSVDAAFFGEYWAGFDFPRHMTYFRDEDIAALFATRFEWIERFHQLVPMDWIRSASWRGGPIDRLITRLGPRGMLGPAIAAALAGRSTRVSFRARRASGR